MKKLKILLIDDEILTLNDLKRSVDWEKFGIQEIYTAMNIEKAKEILLKEKIDVLLCDIEMPQGSGLELLLWIREKNYDVEAIILTYHPNFEYMKEAIQLESSGYLLKPVDYEELDAILDKVIKKVKAKRQVQYKRRCQLWGEIIERKCIANKRALEQLGYDETTFYPVLFNVRWFQGELAEQQLRDFSFENILEEIAESHGLCGDIIRISRGYFAVLVPESKNPDINSMHITEICETSMEAVKHFVKCNCTCYLGNEMGIKDIPDFYEECFLADKSNVSRFNTVLRGNLRKPVNNISLPDMKLWESLIENGEYAKLLELANEYLKKMIQTPGYGIDELKRLYYDFIQIAYTSLNKKNIDTHELFANSQSLDIYDKAVYSVEDMLSWMEYVLDRIRELSGEEKNGISTVESVISYIHLNIKEDLSRESIAEEFHFCSDYLDRLFRKEIGCSVSKYILNERLEMASELLLKTDMSISRIAITVGFNKTSHFSALFRKKNKMSPIEYRKNSRVQA